jgi:hypothetical protein
MFITECIAIAGEWLQSSALVAIEQEWICIVPQLL